MKKPCCPLTLIILDGWGYRAEREDNAIAQANTPVWDKLWEQYPHTFLQASGLAVGLPAGQMGNSEVGHLNLGSGRVVYQDFTRIIKAIDDGSFYTNPVLDEAVDKAAQIGHAVHVFGLLSPGGVHSHEDQILALFELAKKRNAQKVYFHAFLDGRDTPPRSAKASIERVEAKFAELGIGRFATIGGRYYAMDRDNRWERVQLAYDAITQGQAAYQYDSALEALEAAYARGEDDEFVKPCIINPGVPMEDGDSVIFMNFRSDRARQITRCFIQPEFDQFERQVYPKLSEFVSLTEYKKDFTCAIAFPPEELSHVFGEVIAKHGYKQLRIAETEKYAHVTFFFNGGEDTLYPGEDRELIPSPKVATYDLQPAMNAPILTDKLIAAIRSRQYQAIICNFANTDMVGHTGSLSASIEAVETVDACLGRIIEASRLVGGEVLVTADHGNAEKMRDPETGQPHTAHTSNPVPFIYVGERALELSPGALCDVSPTMLGLLGLPIPTEMTGQPLFTFYPEAEKIPA